MYRHPYSYAAQIRGAALASDCPRGIRRRRIIDRSRPRGGDARPRAPPPPPRPPPLKILTDQPGFGRGGDFFVTPTGDTTPTRTARRS